MDMMDPDVASRVIDWVLERTSLRDAVEINQTILKPISLSETITPIKLADYDDRLYQKDSIGS